MTAPAHPRAMHGDGGSLNRLAAVATLHCLTGCAIGEVLGMVIGTALGWSNAATIALAVFLAFVFGYSLTLLPLVRGGLTLAAAVPVAFAADSFSIAVMELVDNGVMLAVPGAMDAPLTNPLFWGALAFALAVAYVVAFPVNRYLIARGRGHAVVHAYHGSDTRARDVGHEMSAHERHQAHGGHSAHETRAAGEQGSGAGGSPRRLVAVGLAAMAATVGIATGGALLVEGGHAEGASAVDDEGGHGGDAGSSAGGLSGLAVETGGLRLRLRETTVRVRRPTRFAFTVEDEHGPVSDFDEEGGVRMHLIVVRRDLTGYQHLHPTLEPDGSWETMLTLPDAGVYRAYADFERSRTRTALAADVFVAGNFLPTPLPAPSTRTDVGAYRVELDARAEPGAEATLSYRITRAGAPVDVEPYLGAAGHLVALREGDLAYLHVHPLAERRGEIRFAATFPTAGRYRLFLQFKDDGRVHTAPLTMSVGADG